MNPLESPKWCTDCWVAMQVFRRLGFSADDVYFGHAFVVGAGWCVIVALCREARFTWVIEQVEGKSADIEATWLAFATHMNSLGDTERNAICSSNTVLARDKFSYLGMWKALHAKGIRCPAFAEADEKIDEILGAAAS